MVKSPPSQYMILFIFLACLYPTDLPNLPQFLVTYLLTFLFSFWFMWYIDGPLSRVFLFLLKLRGIHIFHLLVLGLHTSILGLDYYSKSRYYYLFYLFFLPPNPLQCSAGPITMHDDPFSGVFLLFIIFICISLSCCPLIFLILAPDILPYSPYLLTECWHFFHIPNVHTYLVTPL